MASKEDTDKIKAELYLKIFDLYIKNNTRYYIDKKFNTIWDEKQNIVGIINNNVKYFFEDDDKFIKNILKDKFISNLPKDKII